MNFMSLFKEKWALILLYLVAACLCAITVFFAVLHYSVYTLQTAHLVPPAILAVISLVLFVMLVRKWKHDPSLMFLFIAAPSVFAFCLFMIPGSVPDEYAHICRMFSLATNGAGNMVIPSAFANNIFPSSYEQLCNSLTTVYTWSDFIDQRDMSSYLAHMYIIPGLFSEVLEALNVNPFLTIYFCRGVNATLFLIAGYWIIKILPLGKTIGFIYLLNPMLIQQESSCSADVVVNIVCLLFIAVVLNARFTKGKLSKPQILGIVVLSILVSVSKYAYAPLLLLLFILLPRIKSKKTRTAIVVGCALFVLAALVFILGFYKGGGSYAASLDLARDPILCVTVILKTIYVYSFSYIEQFAGAALGPLAIHNWPVLFIVYYCLLTTALFVSLGEKNELNKIEKAIAFILSIMVTVVLMIATRPWSLNVDLQSDVIAGIQGRYFIPFALLPLLACIKPKWNSKSDNALIGFGSVMVVIECISLAAVCAYFL